MSGYWQEEYEFKLADDPAFPEKWSQVVEVPVISKHAVCDSFVLHSTRGPRGELLARLLVRDRGLLPSGASPRNVLRVVVVRSL